MQAIVRATVLENRWIPDWVRRKLSPKQAQFLAWDGLEALYGGAGGGGKSFALLMGALQYADTPGYHALILRRTYQQLAKPEAIMSLSREWLHGTGAKWNEKYTRWSFPSGATLTFGHMDHENDKYNYQGAAYRYVAFDELTQFTETQYLYLFSRLRRAAGESVPLRVRSASNPGGVGHEWVKARFITAEPTDRRRFFPARLEDNTDPDGRPNIDADEYRKSLAELPPLERAQIEAGDWDAYAGGRFDAAKFRRYAVRGKYLYLGERPFNPFDHLRFLTVDPAASEKQTADYTVISAWAVTPQKELVWLDCHRAHLDVPDIVPAVEAMAAKWKAQEVCIEEVAANNAVYKYARRTGMPVRRLSPMGKDKLVRATPAMVLADDGRLWLPLLDGLLGPFPLAEVVGELVRFTGSDQDAHDDIVDSLSYAAERLRSHTGGGAVPAAGTPLAGGGNPHESGRPLSHGGRPLSHGVPVPGVRPAGATPLPGARERMGAGFPGGR